MHAVCTTLHASDNVFLDLTLHASDNVFLDLTLWLDAFRAHNVILQPAVTVEELLQHVASAPSAWVGAAGGAPLRDQSVKLPASAQSDRFASTIARLLCTSLYSLCMMSCVQSEMHEHLTSMARWRSGCHPD